MIKIDTDSFVPIYAQILEHLKREILLGRLKPGDPLPSIRDLASRLLVNPNTVARAYRELEREDWVAARRGKGSFVTERAVRGGSGEIRKQADALIDQTFDAARRLGLTREEFLDLLRERLNPDAGEDREGEAS